MNNYATTILVEIFPLHFSMATLFPELGIHDSAVSVSTAAMSTRIVALSTTRMLHDHFLLATDVRLADIELAIAATMFPEFVETTFERSFLC